LLGRQLPQITDRLKSTLDKLQSPQLEYVEPVSAAAWWREFKQRYAHLPVLWQGEARSGEALPGALFDSVAENLLQNALAKRQRQPGLAISVCFADGCLSVADNGSAMAPSLSCALFREPVDSEDGLGIGLYQAARQAEGAGYLLALADNQPGRVAFTLSPRR
jgi:hypothetical protein